MAAKKQNNNNNTQAKQTHKNAPSAIDDRPFYGVMLDDDQFVFANAIWDKDIDIVFCDAMAGCGKTFVATGVANMLIQYGIYSGIVYIMSPYADKKQGWLPGSIEEKSSVYFDAFYQALDKCGVNRNISMNTGGVVEQDSTEYITCITDTYLRGVNLDDKVVIIDEAQNYTLEQLQKVLTRVGNNTKVIVIGHHDQCDLERKGDSGFVRYINHFSGQPKAAVCELKTNHRGWISQYADMIQK